MGAIIGNSMDYELASIGEKIKMEAHFTELMSIASITLSVE